MYWSEASTLVPKAAPTSVVTSAPSERAAAISGPISRSRTPARSMKPPKASATRISQTVASMLAMPPRVRSWSMAGSPALETYPPESVAQTPLRSARPRGSPSPAKAITRSGASTTARTPPASAPRKMATKGGQRMIANARTRASGMKCIGDGWKAASMRAVTPAASNSTGVPRLQKSTSAMKSEGPEVRSDSAKCA